MSLSKNMSADRIDFCWECGLAYSMRSAAQRLCGTCRNKGVIVPLRACRIKLSTLCDSMGIHSLE